MADQSRCSGVRSRGCCIAGGDNQRFSRPEARRDREELERLGEPAARLETARDIEAHDAAEILHLTRRASAWPGSSAKPRVRHAFHRRVRHGRNSAMRCAPRHWASRRTKEAPQTAQHEERGMRVERRPEDRQVRPHAAWISSARPMIAPPITSPWPGHVLGQAVHVEVEVELAVAVRPGQRVVEQRQRAVPAGEAGDAGRYRRP